MSKGKSKKGEQGVAEASTTIRGDVKEMKNLEMAPLDGNLKLGTVPLGFSYVY